MFEFLCRKKPVFHNGVCVGYWVGKPFSNKRHTNSKMVFLEKTKGFVFILKHHGEIRPRQMLDPGFRENCLTYVKIYGHMLATQITRLMPEGHVFQSVFLEETDKTTFEECSEEEYLVYFNGINYART